MHSKMRSGKKLGLGFHNMQLHGKFTEGGFPFHQRTIKTKVVNEEVKLTEKMLWT